MIIRFAVENDGIRVKSEYDRFGFAQFVAKGGQVYFITHAYSDATLEVEPSKMVDQVICCYPAKVARRFATVGDWSGESRIRFYTKHVQVTEKN